MLVYHFVPDVQDGGRKPEVQITFLYSYRYRCRSKAEMALCAALPIKPHTLNLELQWATPSSSEYQDGGQEPEVVIIS